MNTQNWAEASQKMCSLQPWSTHRPHLKSWEANKFGLLDVLIGFIVYAWDDTLRWMGEMTGMKNFKQLSPSPPVREWSMGFRAVGHEMWWLIDPMARNGFHRSGGILNDFASWFWIVCVRETISIQQPGCLLQYCEQLFIQSFAYIPCFSAQC